MGTGVHSIQTPDTDEEVSNSISSKWELHWQEWQKWHQRVTAARLELGAEDAK